MSLTKASRAGLWWLIAGLLIVGSLWIWQSRQQIVDLINYYQYKPTAQVRDVADRSKLTDSAEFLFYATRPAVESSQAFNGHCERKEPDSPILGCYDSSRIFIFDVTDKRLEGIETVTAAHELLHAAYERLSDSEKKTLQAQLEEVYRKIVDDELRKRMAYYEKTEPGQSINELHSIIGTEYTDIGPELEEYYARYFTNRLALVKLHTQVESVFDKLSNEAKALVKRINALAGSINAETKQYNTDIQILNQAIESFNERARASGGFTTQGEFEAARQQLMNRADALSAAKQAINSNILTYKALLAQLDSINTQSESLSKNLDSTLSDVPTI